MSSLSDIPTDQLTSEKSLEAVRDGPRLLLLSSEIESLR